MPDRVPAREPGRRRGSRRALALVLLAVAARGPQAARAQVDAHGRVASDGPHGRRDKLRIPADQAEAVWSFLHQRLLADPAYLVSLDPALAAEAVEEVLLETYFDTPSFEVAARQGIIRHRRRAEPGPTASDPGAGQRVQVLLGAVGAGHAGASEVEFEVKRPPRAKSPDDIHPLLGQVRRGQRADLRKHLADLGIDPAALKPILSLRDDRRRVDLRWSGRSFGRISLDRLRSRIWWARAEVVELGAELDPVAYAGADPAARRRMEAVQSRLLADLQAAFPAAVRDLTPGYLQCLSALESGHRWIRWLIRYNLATDEWMVALVAMVSLAGLALVYSLVRWLALARRRGAVAVALVAAVVGSPGCSPPGPGGGAGGVADGARVQEEAQRAHIEQLEAQRGYLAQLEVSGVRVGLSASNQPVVLGEVRNGGDRRLDWVEVKAVALFPPDAAGPAPSWSFARPKAQVDRSSGEGAKTGVDGEAGYTQVAPVVLASAGGDLAKPLDPGASRSFAVDMSRAPAGWDRASVEVRVSFVRFADRR